MRNAMQQYGVVLIFTVRMQFSYTIEIQEGHIAIDSRYLYSFILYMIYSLIYVD